MRPTLPLACLLVLLGTSGLAFAAPSSDFPAHAFRGAWHCQTPPDAQTLLPVECGRHNFPLSQAQQKEYDRLSKLPAGQATRYDRSRIFQLNRQIRSAAASSPTEVGDQHAPPLPVLVPSRPVLRRSIITPPPRQPASLP